jgi:uncharacterized protein YyaL (SSP411 family)
MKLSAAADAVPPRRANRLANEDSLYLRQHAHNPVDWWPWCDQALALARELDRPIFLSIGYSSCHWCHVMEREVFDRPDVAELLNREYVCIKVDREERPDLDAAYMRALVALTGRGGWPASLWLTPEFRPFHAATYVPGDTFIALVGKLAQVYRERREDVEGVGRSVAGAVLAEPEKAAEPLADSPVPPAARTVLAAVDQRWGGLVGDMKFPTPSVWLFLLRHYRRIGHAGCADAVKRTLDMMAAGGVRDHIGGGFHRYSTDRQWLVPHFEKMLYDNAQLASLYIEASVAFGWGDYAFVADGLFDLFTASGKVDYLALALRLLERILSDFQRAGGGFHLTPASTEAPLGRAAYSEDGAEPSGGAIATRALLRPATMTEDQRYSRAAQDAMAAGMSKMARYPTAMTAWLDCAQRATQPTYQVVVACGDLARDPLAGAVRVELPCNAELVPCPAEGPSPPLADLVPSSVGKTAHEGRSQAYVCGGGVCHPPVAASGDLLRLLGTCPAAERVTSSP